MLGLPEDMITALSSGVWGWSKEGVGEKQVNELNMNMSDRRLRLTLELAQQLMGAPRHLGQHPGGFVLTNDRLDELVPIEQARLDSIHDESALSVVESGRTEKSKLAYVDGNPQRSNAQDLIYGIVHASFDLSVRFRTALVLTPCMNVIEPGGQARIGRALQRNYRDVDG